MYEEVTRGVRISVNPVYLESQSEPDSSHFVWAYQVRIVNEGEETVQLLTRHWKITDGRGRLQEVQGPGVVGEQSAHAPNSRSGHALRNGVPACFEQPPKFGEVRRAGEPAGHADNGDGLGPLIGFRPSHSTASAGLKGKMLAQCPGLFSVCA